MKFVYILIPMILLLSCRVDEEDETGKYSTTVLNDYEVLIDFESQKLLQPAEVEMVGEDRLIISDFGSFSLKKFDIEGNLLNEFGGEGDGPGEFRSASSLTVDGDDVYVFDHQNQRFVRFSTDGEFINSFTHEYENRMFPSHTVTDGNIYSTKGGVNNSLLARFDQDGDQLESFGEPVGELSDDFGEIMQSSINQAENEEIPDALKNVGSLTHINDTVWMTMMGKPRIYRITPDGNFTGFDFEVERREQIESAFFETMAEMEQPALFAMQYISDLAATSEYLYLLNMIRDDEEPAAIYQVSNEGEITNRFELEHHTGHNYRLTVSPDDEHIYLTNSDEASLIRYEI